MLQKLKTGMLVVQNKKLCKELGIVHLKQREDVENYLFVVEQTPCKVPLHI